MRLSGCALNTGLIQAIGQNGQDGTGLLGANGRAYAGGGGGGGLVILASATSLTGGSPQPAAPLRIGITILGGARVRGEAFYQLDNDATPKTLAQVEPLFPAAMAGTIALRLYDDSVSRDHAAVTGLIAVAERNGWKVVTEEYKGQSLPPETKRS